MTDYKLVPVEPTPEMLTEIKLIDTFTWKALRARYRAMLAAAPAVQGEPVGYVRPHQLEALRSGKACGITLEDKPDAHNRVTVPLYAAPQPAEQQPAPDVAKMQRKLEASFRREEQLEAEVRELKREKFKKFRGEECWIWSGDGSDRLETLTCPVVITPADLMAIINRGSPSPDVAGLVQQHHRDSAELRRLCQARDQQRDGRLAVLERAAKAEAGIAMMVDALDLARSDLSDWIASFPEESHTFTARVMARIDAALAAHRKQ